MAMRKRGETVRPRAMSALVDLEGPTKACEAIGIKPTTWHRAVKAGTITKAYEVAAGPILAQLAAKIKDDTALTDRQRRGLEYARKHLMNRIKATEREKEQELAPEPMIDGATERKLMLVEGPPEKLKALRDAAQWLGVKTEE